MTLDNDIKKCNPVTQLLEPTIPKVNEKRLEDYRSKEATAVQ